MTTGADNWVSVLGTQSMMGLVAKWVVCFPFRGTEFPQLVLIVAIGNLSPELPDFPQAQLGSMGLHTFISM